MQQASVQRPKANGATSCRTIEDAEGCVAVASRRQPVVSPILPMGRGLPRSAAPAFGLVIAVALTTAAGTYGLAPSAAALSFSPNRLAQGHLWLLLASGLVVDRPVFLSLASFAVLAFVTLAICGRQIFWRAAIYGHVGSTLIVYAFIAVARDVHPGVFSSALNARDYGVSAISSAWLAATATTAWRLRPGRRPERAGIVIVCGAIALFAYMIRRDTSVLSSEHLVAFFLGFRLALPTGRPTSLGVTARRSRLRRRAITAVACSALMVGGAEAPEAYARLVALLVSPQPTGSGCIQRWNDARLTSGRLVGDFSAVSVDVVRKHRAVSCRFRFSGGPDRTDSVIAGWHRNRLDVLSLAPAGGVRANADVLPDGTIRPFVHQRDFDAFTSL